MSEFKLRFSVETVSLLYPLGSNFRRLMMDVAFEVIEDLITSCLQLVGWPSSSLTRGSHLRASHGSVCDRDQNAIKRSRQPWSGNQAIKVTQERQSKDQDEFRATECRINGYWTNQYHVFMIDFHYLPDDRFSLLLVLQSRTQTTCASIII